MPISLGNLLVFFALLVNFEEKFTVLPPLQGAVVVLVGHGIGIGGSSGQHPVAGWQWKQTFCIAMKCSIAILCRYISAKWEHGV